MSRIIKTESAGKDRTILAKSIVITLRELMSQTDMGDESLDMVAYISLALCDISQTIDDSVQAWEKRGYWVKADRFRMEWNWTGQLGEQMKKAVIAEDWSQIAALCAQIGTRLPKVNVGIKHRLGSPWIGAYEKLTRYGVSG